MRAFGVLHILLLIGAASVCIGGLNMGAMSQTAPPTAQPTPPSPPPSSTPAPTPPPEYGASVPSDKRVTGGLNPTFPISRVPVEERVSRRLIYLQQFVAPMYRKPTDKELSFLEPAADVRAKFQDVLRTPRTGILRLIPDLGCAVSDRVVNAAEECLKYSLPGAGNSYSFRIGNYRIKQLSDLSFNGKSFRIDGQFMHGIMVDLGRVSIADVTLLTPGLKLLTDFTPSTTFMDIVESDRSFGLGVEKDGYRYAKSADVRLGDTYVLRNIAFRGKMIRAVNGISYNELDYDKRKDVTVAFTVAAIDPDGGVTIVWKMLDERESPKLKLPKKDDKDNDSDKDDEAEGN